MRRCLCGWHIDSCGAGEEGSREVLLLLLLLFVSGRHSFNGYLMSCEQLGKGFISVSTFSGVCLIVCLLACVFVFVLPYQGDPKRGPVAWRGLGDLMTDWQGQPTTTATTTARQHDKSNWRHSSLVNSKCSLTWNHLSAYTFHITHTPHGLTACLPDWLIGFGPLAMRSSMKLLPNSWRKGNPILFIFSSN